MARDSHERDFWSIFASAHTPMLILDDQRRYVNANLAACEALGLTREELLALRVDDIAPPGRRELLDERWATFLREGMRTSDYRWILPDGREIEVEFTAVANVLPGQHLGILVTAREDGDGAARRLTSRELEVLRMIALGHTGREIATTLGISPRTVATHTRNILGKLGARSRAHAIALAAADGALPLRFGR